MSYHVTVSVSWDLPGDDAEDSIKDDADDGEVRT